MHIIIANCQVDYLGKLSAHLPPSNRLIMFKADGSVSIHSDDRAFKPLNWMNPPCEIILEVNELGIEQYSVTNLKGEKLIIQLLEKQAEFNQTLGVEPGIIKDGVEADLQRLLAQNITIFGAEFQLIKREYATAIGPVDILAKDKTGFTVAIEVKRNAEIAGVEQLTRYLELLNRDALLAPVRGILAAQYIRPQARILANDRGIECVIVDYQALKGIEPDEYLLF